MLATIKPLFGGDKCEEFNCPDLDLCLTRASRVHLDLASCVAGKAKLILKAGLLSASRSI